MSFDWTEYLRLAEALKSDPEVPGPREAALRSAASRAYYAAFNYAVEFACLEGFAPTHTGTDHGKVRAHFRNSRDSNKTRAHISAELDRLYKRRCDADYEPDVRNAGSLADYAVQLARSIVEDLDSLRLP